MSDIVKKDGTQLTPKTKRELIIKIYSQVGRSVLPMSESRLRWLDDYVMHTMSDKDVSREWDYIKSGEAARLINTMRTLQSSALKDKPELIKAFQMLQRSVAQGVDRYRQENKEIDDEAYDFVKGAVSDYINNLQLELLGVSDQARVEGQDRKLIEKKNPIGASMKAKNKKVKRKNNPSSDIKLFAQPYDIEANGFYFKSLDEYKEKARKNKNSMGQIVEEYEFQFIDGSEFSEGQKVLDALGMAKFLEIAESWKASDIFKLEVFIECEGSFNLQKDLDDLKSQLDDCIMYEGSDMTDLKYGMFEDYYAELKNLLEDNNAFDWFDYEKFIDSHFRHEGTFLRKDGKAIYFECMK